MKASRKTFLIMAMMMTAGIASAQVKIEGNLYGGGNIGEVTENTSVTVNGGTIGDTLRLKHRVVDKDVQLTTRVEYGNVYGGGNGFSIDPVNGVPIFDIVAGRVRGNTEVTIQGDAVVRRAVYGGGNMASVGIYTANNGVATYTSGGHTVVTVTGKALIGPKKTDLTNPTPAELDSARAYYHKPDMSQEDYVDSAFKYLGANEGWVFGSSRGFSGDDLSAYSFVDTTEVTINGNAQVLNVFGSGENGHVKKGTNVIVGGNALIGGVPLHGAGEYTVPASGITTNIGEYMGASYELADKDSETAEDEFGVGREITRGNVLGGGKGTDFNSSLYCYTAGRVYGNTYVTVQDNARIYNRVYGGGLIASVGTFTEDANHAITGVVEGTGLATVTISGGIIGSPGSDGLNNGEVYGGSRGLPGRRVGNGGTIDPLHQAIDLAYVGNTHVTIDDGTVMNSVYGGGANGHVQENSKVVVSGGTIGTDGVGGWHGNVFSGGGGTTRYKDNNTLNLSITAGRVFGDTYLEMTGGHVLHNVYGGGAIASVGTYNASELVNPTNPYLGFGHSKITITGGEIGTNGNNNGMVFGSGRGQIAEPGNFLDYVTYVAYSEVNIGTGTVDPETGAVSNLSGNAKINGSVYGSGENGHIYMEAVVNVFGGTIGIAADDYDPANPDPHFLYRGNVYGAGCGTDKYIVNIENPGTEQADTTWAYNPLAGMVQGNTKVNIYGGYISRSVYGGGAMASVGSINHPQTVKHLYKDHETQPSLSWPYELEYTTITDSVGNNVTTGKAEVNIRGGHIGTLAAPVAECGNVFGSARGDVGPLGVMDTLAIVRETEVNVNFTPSTGEITDATPNVIIGSVYGSGENGTVYENTKVTLADGLVRGSVFGGGDGTDMYSDTLWVVDASQVSGYSVIQDTLVHSITSGKVYGNTEVFINGGTVRHNVFGGGNLASVGKGSYMGYGEMSDEDIEPTEEPYLNSGVATVTINGGTIGTTGYPNDGYNNGFVFGSSKGITFKTINKNPRYNYSRDFFVGYTNKTEVIIGDPDANVTTGPTIKGSVFGGGDNGHVRWHTDVTVNKGEIGEGYDPTDGNITDDKWAYRGNVYGAGQGTDMYDSDGNGSLDSYCPSAGSVTLNTNVTVNGGTIHRNVYGGGSMATVGPPPTGYDPGTSTCTVNIFGGIIGQVVTPTSGVPFNYGGNVYGAGRGIIDQLAPLTQYASASNTEVNVNNGSGTVIGNVYGGGSYGQVKEETEVNMIGGSVEGSIFGGGMGFETEEIAGLVKGNATVNMTGGIVKRSVYGGGQMGSVGTFLSYNDVIYNAGQTNAFTVQVPKTCAENTGLTTVKMSGGNVGLLGSLMPWENHNPDDDDRGWIFCGGQGLADSITYPKAIALGVVNCTHLQISNTTSGENTIRPVVTASVYGGAENGLVLDSTFVEIAGGQIGTGHYKTGTTHHFDQIYDEDRWTTAITAINNGTIETALAPNGSLNGYFHECDAWEYGDNDGNIKVYDINYGEQIIPDDPSSALYEPEITALQGTDGHSFFGNVFGGGSGYYPIAPGVWRPTAGQVNGNTRVEITGGHILTAVFGGNETTDVKGESTIKMNGGTVGIPRTKASIQARPVNGNIFGAGMGDPRTMFNAMTNVKKTQVYLTGGTVFGNVYGGSREGHVLDSTLVVIGQEDGKSTLIGTTGFSGYDGLVFGGGRGKDQLLVSDTLGGRRQFPVGRVGGNTHVTMSQGKVLGNIYGGGQVGLVGVDEDGWITSFVQGAVYDSIHHGLSKVEVSGGTIGNLANNGDDLLRSDQAAGNVYGGGRGDLDEYVEDDLGRVAKSIVNISGDPDIYGSVFGGGQMANVGYWIGYGVGYAKGTSASGVNIIGSPKIGIAHEFGLYDPDYQKTQYDTINGMRMISHTRTGNVFGGGQGNVQVYKDNNDKYHVVGLEHGHCGKTTVSIGMNNGTSGGQILGSVFGGSEQGAIWGDTKVIVTGGTIGKEEIVCDTLKYVDDNWVFVESDSTYSYGSVYGGSYGADAYRHFHMDPSNLSPEYQRKVDSVFLLGGRVYGNTFVEITGGAVRGNVFGGGDIASVGEWDSNFVPTTNTGKATVTIGGSAVIGPLDWTGLNAYVYGAGKGLDGESSNIKAYCNVNSTTVNVNGGHVYGSVFGGSAYGHVIGDTDVEVHTGAMVGTIGNTGYDGNIFGGGMGSGDFVEIEYPNTNNGDAIVEEFRIYPTCGRVGGNTYVNITNGYIKGSIYGGGSLALTGVDVDGNFPKTPATWNPTDHGNTYINIVGNNIQIGTTEVKDVLNTFYSVGDVFGSGRGDIENYMDILAGRVTNSNIIINGNSKHQGSVFGGGEMASIGWWDTVFNGNVPVRTRYLANTGKATITISGTPIIGTEEEHYATLNNAGEPVVVLQEGATPIPTPWTIFDGDGKLIQTCTGNVFGGSQGEAELERPHWTSMARSRESEITINGGTILNKVIGGSEQGSVAEDTWVKVNGGTIGSIVNVGTGAGAPFSFGGVYGGGYGCDNPNESSSIIPNDSTSFISDWTPGKLAGRVYGNTLVDIMGGTLKGNVYGGGERAYLGSESNTTKGNATVNIGKGTLIEPGGDANNDNTLQGDATFVGTASVFGANKYEGTPYGNVTVNVFKTHHYHQNDNPNPYNKSDYCPTIPEGTTDTIAWLNGLPDNPLTNYAIYNVFGGSDMTDYLPNENKEATVNVYLCSENTIYKVYGGSSTASIGSTTNDYETDVNVNIFGGRMHQVFGGGYGTPETPANINGTASTTINGGIICELYGGSDSYGNVNTINLMVNKEGSCPVVIGHTYGGGNESPEIGDIYATIECNPESPDIYGSFYGGSHHATHYGNVTVNVYGGIVGNLFGGSEGAEGHPADIKKYPTDWNEEGNPGGYSQEVLDFMATHPQLAGTGGNVTVNLYGGTITNVFGGSDVNGNIEGIIKVNVMDDEGQCPLDITNLYGAGQITAYTPDSISVTQGEQTIKQTPISPVINLIHIVKKERTVNGNTVVYGPIRNNVYGGAKGGSATVTSNPQVNIGYVESNMANLIPSDYPNPNTLTNWPSVTVNGNVFGGGEEASILGNTEVNMVSGEIGVMSVHKIEGEGGQMIDSIIPGLNIPYYDLSGGRVYGGGQGDDRSDTLGWVSGNTNINISGGKIHNCIYGGGMLGSVGSGDLTNDSTGVATITMTGGELGPLDGTGLNAYVFGGGRGKVEDGNDAYWDFANVDKAVVNVSGDARIYGSIFGGSQDGHVLDSAIVNFSAALLGTTGQTTWDGNIFGGGRGYDGLALSAGNVGSNVVVNMTGGHLLGSIYGGGRLASVGLHHVSPTIIPDPEHPEQTSPNPLYGQINPDDKHGNITVNIKGGIIGNDDESIYHYYDNTIGGNVYGGSMGRLTLLDGAINPVWPELAKARETSVNVSGSSTQIRGNVYGGGQLGIVAHDAKVTITNGTIWRDVYGSGKGSSDHSTHTTITQGDQNYTYTPMALTGRVFGNTEVNIEGGWVKKSVYGGGELASVGHITDSIKHDSVTSSPLYHPLNISWPYQFDYENGTGIATVNVKGGRIGIAGKDFMGPWDENGNPIKEYRLVNGVVDTVLFDLTNTDDIDKLKKARKDNGDVFGGGKGIAGPRYTYAHCANVDSTVVVINYTAPNATPEDYKPEADDPNHSNLDYVYKFYPTVDDWTYATKRCIAGALYGGGENGHVNNNTEITFNNGLVGHNIYGGGKGSDTYEETIYTWGVDPQTGQPIQTGSETKEITSVSAGKVYNNTSVTINGGYVVRNVYGGGNRASVGKANYASGPGVYQEAGYGEHWTQENAAEMKGYLDNSGHSYVNVFGGQIGTFNGEKDNLPTGSVFGGGRGEPAPNVPQLLSPRIFYYPEFFLAYVNHTHVTIGEDTLATPNANSPRLYGSVYGGGEDGHVRWSTDVVVNDGEIGNEYKDPTNADTLIGTSDLNHFHWVGRGNVYGAGSGLTMYDDNGVDKYSYAAGSVTQFTNVTINGGLIHRNVYGGGSLATVGPPRIRLKYDADSTQTLARVNIKGKIGLLSDVDGHYTVEEGGVQVPKTFSYGGHVFGGSRGIVDANHPELNWDQFSTTIYTQVNLDKLTKENQDHSIDTVNIAHVLGNVYGGGQLGCVLQCTDVNVNDGTVGTIGYVKKQVRPNPDPNPTLLDSIVHTSGGRVFGGGQGLDTDRNAALVKDSTNVTISGGHVLWSVYGGGELASVGLRDVIWTNETQTVVKDYIPKQSQTHIDSTGVAMVNILGGQVGPAPMFMNRSGNIVEPSEADSINVPCGLNGIDGYVFGGGKGVEEDYIDYAHHPELGPYSGLYYEFADVNNAIVTVNMPMDDGSHTNRLWGSIFGGAEDGHVLGDVHTYYYNGLMGTEGTTSYDGNIFGGGRNYSKANYNAGRVRGNITVHMGGGQIYGSIFGGGRLALTGVDLFGNILTDEEGENGAKYGNVFVKVNGGTVGNDTPVQVTYPGGATVTMPFIQNFTKHPMGDVFGGGKGSMEGIVNHPKASALLVSLVKNTEIIVTDSVKEGILVGHPKILGSVFGGGEVGTVGQFEWANVVDPLYDPDDPDHPTQYTIGDITLKKGTGKTKVTVSGGQIGYDRMLMDYTLVGGNGADKYNLRFNTDVGHVYGGGEGEQGNPANYPIINPSSTTPGVHNNKRLIDLMGTVGETQVIISDTLFQSGNVTRSAWVKGSVYGGAMNGHVLNDTKVTIKGGQIGAGHYDDKDSLYYGANQFFNPNTYFTQHSDLHDVATNDALAECVSWDYGKTYNNGTDDEVTLYKPFDPVLLSQDTVPSDGKTWFGNVFGGGSGYYPYIVRNHNNTADSTVWNRESGKVYGNTTVIVKGGHILTNIYGGCETTDVGHFDYSNGIEYKSGGESTVTMSGGTLGVPRTLAQIDLHPVTCYIFGAGKGDPRTNFNTWTNVQTATVEVSGGYVYGSVFGGGEEGHVMGDATVTVKNAYDEDDHIVSSPIIGTTGVSYVDGNIFGGGRGFSGEALTAGVVGGNVNVHIKGGTMLGSIYGGGRLASVGTHFSRPDDPNCGQFQDGPAHGKIIVNISGGTIGNPHEYVYSPDPSDPNKKLEATIGGNVFAGCMGRINLLNGDVNPRWPSLGKAKETVLNISEENSLVPTIIKSSVYGGGQFGTVRDNATVSISGGTIGTDVKHPDYNTNQKHYHFGSVYGAGFGSKDMRFEGDYANDSTANGLYKRPVEIAGRVYGNTFVNISGGQVLENVFGGGELASVGMVKDNNLINGVATVTMTGGQVGPLDMTGLNAYVYGGPEGVADDQNSDYKAYCNVNEAHVIMEIPTSANNVINRVWGSLFGGGSDGHVLGDATVDLRGGTLGTTGTTTWDGNIFGGGRNYSAANLSAGRVGGNTTVTVTEGHMYGSIFGGGRLGSVGVDEDGEQMQSGNDHGFTLVNVGGDEQTGEIVIGHNTDTERVGGNVYGGGRGKAGAPESIYPKLAKVKQTEVNIMENSDMQTWIEGSVFGSGEDGHVLQNTYVNIYDGQIGGVAYNTDLGQLTPCANYYHGNVYGGGRGVDKYTDTDGEHYSHTAGHVGQNTFVNIYGGRIVRSVYGGGNLSSVGDPDDPTTGLATVNVLGGSIGFEGEGNSDEYEYRDYGNVFGSGHGIIADDEHEDYKELAYVKNTHVTIDSVAMIYGSVFGGGEDGHVRQNTLVDVKGGVIGQQDEDFLHGNVYGGGRGLVGSDGYISPTAGEVFGHATVNIMQSERKNSQGKYYTPVVWNNVYGGGSRSVVSTYKVVNMSAGTVHDHVFGGSRDIPAARPNKAPRWVNMWGGTIGGNLYGCSHNSIDSVSDGQADKWASFINMSGGTVRGNVFGAGYGGDIEGIITDPERGGVVGGSVGILIGKNAIESASQTEIGQANIHKPATIVMDSLNIFGNVYAGSDMVHDSTWGDYAVSGYSNIYIDGTGYDSEHNVGSTNNPYMYIGSAGGGIYGSGNNCEAGEAGHNILVRNYGRRNDSNQYPNELVHATRSLTTIQRGGTVVLENTNMDLSGASDISFPNVNRKFGVVKVSDGLYVANASGIVLGSGAQNDSVMIDSVKLVKSVYLPSSIPSAYSNMGAQATWEVVGIKGDTPEAARLYRLHNNSGTITPDANALALAEENVIIFYDKSKMRVRYKDEADGIKKYGQLEGFFRMRGDAYDPYDLSESFAYARPKYSDYTAIPELTEGNLSDGGFLSYHTPYNFFFDDGTQYTNTKQHPYLHPYILNHSKNDVEEYRYWVAVRDGHRWYVDGTRGWGRDVLKSEDIESGRFPNKPKKTLFGKLDDGTTNSGVVNEQYYKDAFSYENDIVYVVGALSAADEKEIVRGDTIPGTGGHGINHKRPLKLFRYPGGHMMSNLKIDYGTGDYWANANTGTWDNVEVNKGPGANYGAMVDVQTSKNLTMKAVVLDGLFGYSQEEVVFHEIPTDTSSNLPPDCNRFHAYEVTEPLIITRSNSILTLGDSTVLMRGYNSTDAAYWYTDAFFDTVSLNLKNNTNSYIQSHETGFRHGGAIYVDGSGYVDAQGRVHDKGATVNVTDTVYITDNKQFLRIDATHTDTIESNVFLPTFHKHLYITDELFASESDSTIIGITSPRGNADSTYKTNSLSPVAVAPQSNPEIANAAWINCNFRDDLNWFFVRGNKNGTLRTTYYNPDTESDIGVDNKVLYFGWTWANIVRKSPDATTEQPNYFNYSDISSPYDLAWLISKSAGMNRQDATDFSGVSIKQTADFDMRQYVWVPLGTEAMPFKGVYDGQGHIIDSLCIEYIGKEDSIYQRVNYGMFGHVDGYAKNKGVINRTFAVRGIVKPRNNTDGNLTYNMAGLVGYLEGEYAVVSNSEAAATIDCPASQNANKVVAGGLVGYMKNGHIHSSMTMPYVMMGAWTQGPVGGLVGSSIAGDIFNSFANSRFGVNGSNGTEGKRGVKVGGLLGNNGTLNDEGAELINCYAAVHSCEGLNLNNFGTIVAADLTENKIDSCYVMQDAYVLPNSTSHYDYKFTIDGEDDDYPSCHTYTPVIGSDNLGYMCADNKVEGITIDKDSTLFQLLNSWVYKMNKHKNDSIYAHWARPALSEINGDLPVLLLNEFDKELAYQGNFRSVGTFEGGPALQYGGPVRDGEGNMPEYSNPEIDGALAREMSGDCLFIYGDIVNAPTSTNVLADKVSIYEHAVIKHPGILAEYSNTYVGITFDNSFGKAFSTPGINVGLVDVGGYKLPRDWHMLSTPLSNAPLGFEYTTKVKESTNKVNTNEYDYSNGNHGNYFNNPWVSKVTEFDWLDTIGSNECTDISSHYRYWMKKDVDGYFPRFRGALFSEPGINANKPLAEMISKLFIIDSPETPSDECFADGLGYINRYPYGMDFYTWTEPDNHWINFKRNGPNHWHSDLPHVHLAYKTEVSTNHPSPTTDKNEDFLISSKGYMTAIAIPTMLQSHGKLNSGDQFIELTNESTEVPGWNLVGNPYHGYLDFDLVGQNTDNQAALNGDPFYVVYDADKYDKRDAATAFRYYPKQGSFGGDYADQFIHPHQGFFVKANTDGGTLQFTSDMLVSRSEVGDGGDFRDWQPNYPLVNLYLSSDHGCADVTVIEFERPEWGGARKLKELRVGNGLFYGHHEDENYAALFVKEGTKRVPVRFEAKEDDIFTMKWNTANGDFHSMYLIDNITGIQYDMLRNDTYVFEGHKGDYWSRFLIVFEVTDVEENLEGFHNFVFFDGSQWIATGEGNLEFIDQLGHVLWSERLTGGQTRISLPEVAKSIYLFRLTNSNETKVQKVLVK